MRPWMVCAVLLAALSSAACHTRKAISIDQLRALQPQKAWVTETDQSVVIVSGPQVVGDTLVGYVNGVYEEMPADRFKQIMVEAPATGKTVAVVAVATVAVGGVIYALIGGKGDTDYGGSDFCEEHPEDPKCIQ